MSALTRVQKLDKLKKALEALEVAIIETEAAQPLFIDVFVFLRHGHMELTKEIHRITMMEK